MSSPGPTSSGFQWPTSDPPSAANLALAEILCKPYIQGTIIADIDAPATVTPCNSLGTSAQDLIKVTFTARPEQELAQKDISFMVKIPRRYSPDAAAACRAEGLRAKWAASAGLGPKVLMTDEATGAFVMAFIEGKTLTKATAAQNAERVIVELLRKMHDRGRQERWMKRYDPIAVVDGMLQMTKQQKAMSPEDIEMIEHVIDNARTISEIRSIRLKPCHNDFHPFNILMDDEGELYAIDFEVMNLADPMWDLAYFTADIHLPPFALAEVYGCSGPELARLLAYYPLAISHFATWSATQGPQWKQHVEDLLQRLRIGNGNNT